MNNSLPILAHELKTPLATIQAMIEVLNAQEHKSIEEYEYTMMQIHKHMKRMQDIIELILNAKAGFNEDDEIDVDEIILDVLQDVQAKADAKMIPIQITNTLSRDLRIKGYPILFYRALYNLLENAIKYSTEHSKIEIEIGQDKCLSINIKDQGIGIDPKELVHIFKPFYRCANDGIEGSGLGLYLVKMVVEMHNGTINISSTPKLGTSIQLCFPLQSHKEVS
jgi:signal transduction histidine kinase